MKNDTKRISDYVAEINAGKNKAEVIADFLTEQQSLLNGLAGRLYKNFGKSSCATLEDCRQVACIAVYEGFESYISGKQNADSVENYLFQTVYYRALRILNKNYGIGGVTTSPQTRKTLSCQSVEALNEQSPYGDWLSKEAYSVEDEVIARELQNKKTETLTSALKKLPDEERDVIELSFLRTKTEKKQTVRRVAEQMGISKSQVSVLRKRGLSDLRIILMGTILDPAM